MNAITLLRKGYLFGPDVRQGTDAAATRLLGRPTTVVAGRDGVRLFYDESRLRRRGAVPRILRRTLFGDGAVHGLDNEAHRHRKQMFLFLLTPDAARAVAALAAARWDAAAWQPGERVVLFDSAVQVHGAAVCEWAGVPAGRVDARLFHDLVTVVDGFGSIGPRHVRARLARNRADRWATGLIEDVRRGTVRVPVGTALDVVAHHRSADGTLLRAPVAGVELLNILRPTVAVAYFVAFSALALHDYPQYRDWLRDADDARYEAFAHEVRRYYPFVPLLGARARQPFTGDSTAVPPGGRVLLDVYGTLHHPGLWRDPEMFVPERFVGQEPDPDTLIPQGGGPPTGHRCPGERIAVELIKTAAAVLVRRQYDVPQQDLLVSLSRMPTRPRSGFVLVGRAG